MGLHTDVTEGLTQRQREVLDLVARGKTNFEIAQELGITLDGAKWHLREIMAKFGCDTREEAVAIWQARPGRAQRLRRNVMRPLGVFGTGLGKAGGIAVAGAVAVGAAALIGLAAFAGDSQSGRNSDVIAAENEGPTTAVRASGQATPISFRSCGTATFQRPTIAEMHEPFMTSRFNPVQPTAGERSERPGPMYFAYYLTKFYEIYPHAVSANVGTTALGGSQQAWNGQNLIPASKPCDQAFLQDFAISYYMFRFVDMVPLSASLDGVTLTVMVYVMDGSTTTITFPEPPLPNPQRADKDLFAGLPPVKELRVVGPDGALLFTRGAAGAAQYSPDNGRLEFATNAFGGGEIEFEIRERPQTVIAYASAAQAGAVVVTDVSGNRVASEARQAAPGTWVEVFRKDLEPGVYHMSGGPLLLVREGTPLP